MSMLVSNPSVKLPISGAVAGNRSARQVGYAAPFTQQGASAGAATPKFGFYIPLACEILAGVCCLLPLLGVAMLALLGRRKA